MYVYIYVVYMWWIKSNGLYRINTFKLKASFELLKNQSRGYDNITYLCHIHKHIARYIHLVLGC